MGYKLLSCKQHKADKAVGFGYLQGILQLQPCYRISRAQRNRLEGVGFKRVKCSTCPYAGLCRKSCLADCGFNSAVLNKHAEPARIERTKYLLKDPINFLADLQEDISKLRLKAKAAGLLPVIRLNGTSDLDWPLEFIRYNYDVQFIDYTKDPIKALAVYSDQWPKNYHLTYSWNERSNDSSDPNYPLISEIVVLAANNPLINIAVIFEGKALPVNVKLHHIVMPVIDGDLNDLRFLDQSGAVVGLRFKHPLIHGGFRAPKQFGQLVLAA